MAWQNVGGVTLEDGADMRDAGRLDPLSDPAAFGAATTGGRRVAAAARTSNGCFIVDGTGTLLAFDRTMERLTGWDAADVVGQGKDLGVYDDPDVAGVRRFQPRPLYAGQVPRADAARSVRLDLTRKDGAEVSVQALVTPLGRGGRVSVQVQRVLSRLAAPVETGADEHDPLTRLPRAAQFQVLLRAAFDQARRHGHPLSVLLVDVDHLEQINARFGRERGDGVLRHVAGIIAASVRQSDLVARIQNDDFAVLLPGTGRGDARHVGVRIRSAIEAFAFAPGGDGEAPQVTVSIGVACFPADAEVPFELLRRASDALDEVHRLGRNRVWCYSRRPRVTMELPVYFDGPQAHPLGQCRDLSNSGLFVETRDDLALGMRLGLTFRLPGHPEPVRVIGRVVRRVERAEDADAPIGLAIEFERYSDEDRWRLESFLHQHA